MKGQLFHLKHTFSPKPQTGLNHSLRLGVLAPSLAPHYKSPNFRYSHSRGHSPSYLLCESEFMMSKLEFFMCSAGGLAVYARAGMGRPALLITERKGPMCAPFQREGELPPRNF